MSTVIDAIKYMTKAMEILTTHANAEGGEVPTTPLEKLEKKLEGENEKLEKLNAKIAGGKSKIPDKDAETKTKLEETISKTEAKIAELKEKEAKKAEKAEKPKAVKAQAQRAEGESPNIPKMTPAIKLQLKAAFEGLESNWDDKYYEQFKTEVNKLSEKEYGELTLAGHISAFANKYIEASEAKPAPMVGGGASSIPSPLEVSLADLQDRYKKKTIEVVSPGVFKIKKSGALITGPPEVPEADYEEEEFDGETFALHVATGRVYRNDPDSGSDEFVGYKGAGFL
jgi:DNA repair exonuclease SbcCD ATPase subunit